MPILAFGYNFSPGGGHHVRGRGALLRPGRNQSKWVAFGDNFACLAWQARPNELKLDTLRIFARDFDQKTPLSFKIRDVNGLMPLVLNSNRPSTRHTWCTLDHSNAEAISTRNFLRPKSESFKLHTVFILVYNTLKSYFDIPIIIILFSS